MRTLLFVYGTLRPELAPASMQPFTQQLTKITEGVIQGKLYDLGEYPGAVRSSSGRIHGGVYELADRNILAKFDAYEGFDRENIRESLFIRRRVCVQLAGRDSVRCWVYFFNQPVAGAVEIPSGIYLPK